MNIIQKNLNQFKLLKPFEAAGDQPQAIHSLVEGLNDGLQYQTLLGVTGSGKTYTMANIIAETGRPAIVMVHNKTLAAQLYAEFRDFFPDNAVEYFVSYYDYYQPEAYVPHKDLFIFTYWKSWLISFSCLSNFVFPVFELPTTQIILFLNLDALESIPCNFSK